MARHHKHPKRSRPLTSLSHPSRMMAQSNANNLANVRQHSTSIPGPVNGMQRNGNHVVVNGTNGTNGRNVVMTAPHPANTQVSVVGGGLVGSMVSCFLARRGYKVNLYEMRDDPRLTEHVVGKSINLALSERGRSAMRSLGLEQEILDKYSIKMRARMIHNLDGSRRAIPYGTKDQYILSVSRRFLNERLLTEAERYSNVSVHFKHKLSSANLENGQLTFQAPRQDGDQESTDTVRVETNSDVILGCDGAYSAVRRNMIKLLLLDYSQKYIEHGYLELCIPPTKSGDFAMEPNYLHIWPRGSFMMIALPNLDRSFTVTLFMPFAIFKSITEEPQLITFFESQFPDAIPLLTKNGLIKTFFGNEPSPLISIKCKPYNYKDKVLLMGDAAHAMVPFYGQGMNCGFEDCMVLEELLNQHGSGQLSSVLERFTVERVENCHTIIDLAMYNYIEMRDLVNRKTFLLRKKFDNLMYTFFPNFWIPLYTMVTFTRIPYKKCMDDRRWQDNFLTNLAKLFLLIFGLLAFVFVTNMFDNSPTMNPSRIYK